MKLLTIAELEAKGRKSNDPIWAINTASDSVLESQGEVTVSIPSTRGGDPTKLFMPQTWLPQELTRVITRQQLLSSNEFRVAVDRKLIGLVSAESAAKMLRQEGAAEERARLDALERHIRKSGQARTIADSAAEISRADGTKDVSDSTTINAMSEEVSVAQLAQAGVEDTEPGIKPAFKMWFDKLCTGNDMAALNDIKSRRKFSRAEMDYMAKNMPKSFSKALALLKQSSKR